MKIGIYSYAHADLDNQIGFYQKKVFDKLGIPLTQIISNKSHPAALESIILRSTDDYILFFDVDCIPLTNEFLSIICSQIQDGHTLAGAIQSANHLNKFKSYVGPCFCGFSKKLYQDCGSPSFVEYVDGDVMQRFTDKCVIFNKAVKYWMVTHSGDELWEIPSHGLKFGHETIYENIIYHQFEIRNRTQHATFIEKCKSIINSR